VLKLASQTLRSLSELTGLSMITTEFHIHLSWILKVAWLNKQCMLQKLISFGLLQSWAGVQEPSVRATTRRPFVADATQCHSSG
jgi:hypothetical protein